MYTKISLEYTFLFMLMKRENGKNRLISGRDRTDRRGPGTFPAWRGARVKIFDLTPKSEYVSLLFDYRRGSGGGDENIEKES